MDDSRSRFWERLIVDSVAVVVLAFLLQGLWFGLGAFLGGWKPDWSQGFTAASRVFLVIWLVLVLGGVLWAFLRARDAGNQPAGRR